jgi:hypothetical protein
VATVPLPDTPPARHAAPSLLRPSVGEHTSESAPQVKTAERQRNISDDVLAAPMRSVEVLTPVDGLRTRPSGQ